MKKNYKYTKSALTSTIMLWLISTLTLSAQTGIYTVDGNLTISGVTNTNVQLVDLTGAGTGHDQIATTGDAVLGGTLEIVLDGYTPSSNHQFEIMDITGTQSGTFSSITWPTGMSTWSIDYGVLNPNKVTIYGPSSPLPVEFVSFEVKVMSDYDLLTWQTATEINNDYFEVEYSQDGKSFNPVGRVEGSGNSTNINAYSYQHYGIETGTQYYRLRQVDRDGKHTFSYIKAVSRTEAERTLTLYPNPTTGIVHFSTPVNAIKVYDTSGKLNMSISQKVEQLDMSHLIPGIYYIEIDGSSEKQTITITK